MLRSLLVSFRHIFPAEAVAVPGCDCRGCGFLARTESVCSQPCKAPEKSRAEGIGHSLLVILRIRFTLRGKLSLPHVSTFQKKPEGNLPTVSILGSFCGSGGLVHIGAFTTNSFKMEKKILTFLVFLVYDLVAEGASSCP